MTTALGTQRLFGLDFVAAPTTSVVTRWILDEIAVGGRPGWRLIVTPNVDHVVRYRRHVEELEVAQAAELVLPDGSPIVWASVVLGRRLPARLTGVELFSELFPMLGRGRIPTVLVASDDEVASTLESQHPCLTVIVPPLVELDDRDGLAEIARQVAAAVAATRARVVMIGLSGPKAHRISACLLELEPCPDGPGAFVLMVGAAAEFHIGTRRRAPRWMQRAGLEWLHRLVHDPRRLGKRYLVDDAAFIGVVWGEWRRLRRSRRKRSA